MYLLIIDANSTCIPHLVPLLRLMENPHNKISHNNYSSPDKENSHSRAASFGSLLEQNSSNSSKEESSSLGSFGKDNDKKVNRCGGSNYRDLYIYFSLDRMVGEFTK